MIQERIQIIIEAIQTGVAGTIGSINKKLVPLKANIAEAGVIMNESVPKFAKLTNVGRSIATPMGQMASKFRMATQGLRGFKMEMLSVMFFGMAMQRFFMDLLKPAMEAFGMFELWNTMLLVVFIPIMELLFPYFLSLIEFFMNLPDGVKKAIGILVILGGIFGTILFLVGTIVLGLGGLALAGSTIGAVFAVAGAIFAVVAGVIAIVIGFIDIMHGKWRGIGLIIMGIGAILILFIGWWALLIIAAGAAIYWIINNWTKVKEFFSNILRSIKDFFIKTFGVDVVGYLFNLGSKFMEFGRNVVTWIVNGIKSIGSRIWDAILSGFGKAKGFVSDIFGGMKTYGDVIWRPGSAPIAVSPQDTITASKGGLGGIGGGSVNYSPTYYVNVADKNEFQRMIELNNRKMVEDIRRIAET